jgi:hypothetical protein
MPVCKCGAEFLEARAALGFDCCLDCGARAAAAETARRARMIAPSSHKSGYTYLGPDPATQRQRLLEGSAKSPPLDISGLVVGRAARARPARPRRYEFVGWEFKPDARGVRQKRAILRDVSKK